MCFLKASSKRHGDRHHDGHCELLKEGKRPRFPIYENYKEYCKDPFNVVPKLAAKVEDVSDSEDERDLTSGLVKHTTVFDDCFTVEDRCQTRPVSDLSPSHSLLPPRKKLNSHICSGMLKSRREKQ